ncbi:hypothetical protein [Niallia nealsonii]|uniref:hypothetical protein n=1 Tax=Niallia nealsonii TaxID=115979 RepID=UPI0012FF4124|nr:hypothetical protein [Niallia nealsonii]
MNKELLAFLNEIAKIAEERDLCISKFEFDDFPVADSTPEQPTLVITVKTK